MKRHPYIPPHNILSPEKQLLRKKWIYQYAKEGTPVKEIAKIFYSLSIKRIKEIIKEMTPELRKCRFCGKQFIAIGEEKRNICPECLRKFLLFENINWRYALIMRYRFGLDNGISRTLEETGKKFRVTRERIRQIEAKSLEMIKYINHLT